MYIRDTRETRVFTAAVIISYIINNNIVYRIVHLLCK